MSKPAIVLDHVWKKFRRGERHDSLRDLIPSAFRNLLGRKRLGDDELAGREFWAVKDLSFEVHPGEALGIVGPNGAGKSTTLKLLTRILRPTRGSCHVRGRVGALIEVASGFHPDLTGRENVFLQGAIMGMRRAEILSKLDAIVDFAGVSDFIDTPVKRYSSGMNARLGFSIAAHLNPDVLIVDEVLSVGDMSFQARCLERMRERVADGVALAFVSHNLQTVSALCRRAVVLGRGGLLFSGATDQALQVYVEALQMASGKHGAEEGAFLLRTASLEWPDGESEEGLTPHSRGVLRLQLDCLRDQANFNVGLEIERTRDLLYCYGLTTEELGHNQYSCKAGDVLSLTLEFVAHFARGHYRLNVNIFLPSTQKHLFAAEAVGQFSIVEHRSYDGVTDIEPRMDVVLTPGELPEHPSDVVVASAQSTNIGTR